MESVQEYIRSNSLNFHFGCVELGRLTVKEDRRIDKFYIARTKEFCRVQAEIVRSSVLAASFVLTYQIIVKTNFVCW